jgi:hypothetical protein
VSVQGDNLADAFCSVCCDKFEEFFNDEMEECHLHAAVRVDKKIFHPFCYKDYKIGIFVMMLRLLLETSFCHFDKMLALSCWLHSPQRTLTSFMT